MSQKTYTINGKEYYQKPLVIGQVMPLLDMLEGVEILELTVTGLLRALGNNLPVALAVVLYPTGVNLEDKDIESLSKEFRETLEVNVALEVIDDFLACNPLSSISARMRDVMFKLIEVAKGAGVTESSSLN